MLTDNLNITTEDIIPVTVDELQCIALAHGHNLTKKQSVLVQGFIKYYIWRLLISNKFSSALSGIISAEQPEDIIFKMENEVATKTKRNRE